MHRLVALLLFALLATPSMATAPPGCDTGGPRIVAVNWSLVQTLIALGAPPVGVANTDSYRKWVAEPPLPDCVADIGRRLEPNLTVVSGLRPDRVVMSAFYGSLARRLTPIAPVETLTIYKAGGDPYQRALDVAAELAGRTGTEAALGRLERQLRDSMAALTRARQAAGGTPRVYVVQFRDANHVRVFGEGSLFNAVLERAGFRNAWQGPANAWGFALAEITELDQAADHLLVIDPVPADAERMMANSSLWRALPATQGKVRRLAPVWAYGGVTTAIRFAELAREALYPAAVGVHD